MFCWPGLPASGEIYNHMDILVTQCFLNTVCILNFYIGGVLKCILVNVHT